MKIVELKKECKKRGIKTSGKKVDIIKRLSSYENGKCVKQEYSHLASIKTKTIILDDKGTCNTDEIETETDEVFKMLELLDKIQGSKKFKREHPISEMRMKCYKQLLGIIAKVLLLTENKKDDVNYKEKMSLISELRKYAESNRRKILEE